MKVICKFVMGFLFLLILCSCNPFTPVYDEEKSCEEAIILAALVFTDPDYVEDTKFKNLTILSVMLNCDPNINETAGELR